MFFKGYGLLNVDDDSFVNAVCRSVWSEKNGMCLVGNDKHERNREVWFCWFGRTPFRVSAAFRSLSPSSLLCVVSNIVSKICWFCHRLGGGCVCVLLTIKLCEEVKIHIRNTHI